MRCTAFAPSAGGVQKCSAPRPCSRITSAQYLVAAEVGGAGVVGAARELHPGLLREPDEGRAGNPPAVVDLHGDALRGQAVHDRLHPRGRPEAIVISRQLIRDVRGIDINVDRLVGEDARRALDQGVHELLRIANSPHVFRDPESHALAAVVGPGHRIREDVVELFEGRLREHPDPLAALGLHRLVNRLAVQFPQKRLEPRVVLGRLAEPAIDRETVVDAGLPRPAQRVLDGQPAFRVDVIVRLRPNRTGWSGGLGEGARRHQQETRNRAKESHGYSPQSEARSQKTAYRIRKQDVRTSGAALDAVAHATAGAHGFPLPRE